MAALAARVLSIAGFTFTVFFATATFLVAGFAVFVLASLALMRVTLLAPESFFVGAFATLVILPIKKAWFICQAVNTSIAVNYLIVNRY